MPRRIINEKKPRLIDKRTSIVASASRCFLKMGFGATSLDDISAESGVVKQTIYNYFDTKDTLFRATIDYLMQSLTLEADESWFELEPEQYFLKFGQLQFAQLQNRQMTDFLQLAVREFRRFPELQEMYSRCIPEPMLAAVSEYIKRRTGVGVEQANVMSWSYRSAIAGYATLYNVNRGADNSQPSPSEYLKNVAHMFGKSLSNLEKMDIRSKSVSERKTKSDFVAHARSLETMYKLENFFDGQIDDSTVNQKAILSSALKLFVSKGFVDTTMLDIADDADVSKQTVYRHFQSKEILYKAFCAKYIEQLKLKRECIAGLSSADYIDENASANDNFAFIDDYLSALFSLSANDWVIRLFRVLIAESHAFSDEANQALVFLYDFGQPFIQQNLPAINLDSEIDAKTLSLVVRGIAGSFVLLKKIYSLSGTVEIDESNIDSFLKILLESNSPTT